jgi:hypothetical protein
MVSSLKFLSGLRILACLMVFSNVITVVSLSESVSVWCCFGPNNVCASSGMKRDMWWTS